VKDKLRDYGIGDSVVVLGYAQGDPSYRIEIRGYELSLRKAEAEVLVVGEKG
jgi:Fe2+ transport system protein FeoA